MFQWLFLAAIVAVGLSEPAAEPAAAAEPVHHEVNYNIGPSHDVRGHNRDDHHIDRGHSHDVHGHRHEVRAHSRDDHNNDRGHSHDDRHDDRDYRRGHHREHHDGDHIGPNVVRVLNPSQIAFDPHNLHHRKIIENTYSPDYYQPTWILDYRYLKTGGRDYTRSDGGQVLILPKNVHSHEPKDHKFINYDELLEFLRLKQLAEAQKYHSYTPANQHNYNSHGYEHKEIRGYEHRDDQRSYY